MKSSNDFLTGRATGIEIIQDPYAIQQIYTRLVQSATTEILLFLPTTSAFLREQKLGIIQSLQDAARRGVAVRVLTPAEEKISPESALLFQAEETKIGIRHINQKSTSETSRQARTKILIVDRVEYLMVELKDDSKETFVGAVRLAIYSATSSTVRSYVTLFESLWEQSELYDKLAAHDKMQKEFINIAAHELRTPIQPIIGVIDILRLGFKSGADEGRITKDDLEVLARNSGRLERLATDILEVSRIESDSLSLMKEKFDINEKMRKIIRDIKSTKFGKKLEIDCKTDEPLFVLADEVRVFEVISNLIRNAIKFTEEGSITVKAKKKGRFVEVEVKDTGVGINPEIMPKLFTKFATSSHEGTGLGLFISKMIIEAHGGRIWARNNEGGKGATFSFALPVA